jgi:hypothetical protein
MAFGSEGLGKGVDQITFFFSAEDAILYRKLQKDISIS